MVFLIYVKKSHLWKNRSGEKGSNPLIISTFAPRNVYVALAVGYQHAEKEELECIFFLCVRLRQPRKLHKERNFFYTLLIIKRNARINWKKNRNDIRVQCRR